MSVGLGALAVDYELGDLEAEGLGDQVLGEEHVAGAGGDMRHHTSWWCCS